MPLTSPGNDDDTGENHQPTLRKNTAEPVEQTLKQNNSLRALLHADGESGWRAAVAGMLEILESTGGTDRAGVCLAAARHASGLGPVAYDDPVDLSEYDIAYTKEDE